jgi:hypothetical protein
MAGHEPIVQPAPVVGIAEKWLLDRHSEAYRAAIAEERTQLGWVNQPPILLENGNWYFGPAGEWKPIIEPDNANAADTTNTDQLRAGEALGLNLSGAGVTVGTWEAGGGVLATHQEFGGRVTPRWHTIRRLPRWS